MNIFKKLRGIFKKEKEKPDEDDHCKFDLAEWERIHEHDPHFDELCPTVFANAELFHRKCAHWFKNAPNVSDEEHKE